jgi:putative pyruvate formate lyase activating enzyme
VDFLAKGLIEPRFIIKEGFEPCYIKVYEERKLEQKFEQLLEIIKECRGCPRNCGAMRLEDKKTGTCRSGRYAIVSSFFPHHGEEDCLRGWNGSGTIFFSNCNLKCIFCQNYEISWLGEGRETSPEELASMMLYLQKRNCHNINFVTPTHMVAQIFEALLIAIPKGLRLPLVYNTGGYDSPEVIKILEGVIDIYMPDFKYWQPEVAKRFAAAEDYPDVIKEVVKIMHNQVGPLMFDSHGIALRGVLIRHLVLPNNLASTREVARFLCKEVSPDTYINVMAQYYPAGRVHLVREKYLDVSRRLTTREYEDAVKSVQEEGLTRLDVRFPRDPSLYFG